MSTQRVIMTDDYYGYRLPVPDTFKNDFMATEDERWAVLAAIGIEHVPDASPLQAWNNAVKRESGLDEGERLDLAFTPAYVRKFVFYLA